MRIENSFIPIYGVGEATERTLWRQGVTHWDEFERGVVGPTTGERIEAFIDEGRRHLDSGNVRFFAEEFPGREAWRLYENFREGCAFFDIETTGLSSRRDVVTTVSVHRGGETTTLIRGEDLSRERLAPLLDASLLVTFNGASFDVPFLERAFDLELDGPHVDLRYPCKRLGLSGGLAAVERAVGVERDRPDISGRDAVRLWREHEQGVDGSLETLVAYNREDAVNLRELMDHVADRLHEEVFAAACAGSATG